MIRFATIGTNFITTRFLEAAKTCSCLKYACAYSRKEETAASFALWHHAGRYETDLSALACAPDIDAVYIASPNRFHCSQAILMMEHGKHVLCEKPAASNSRELAAMIESAKRNGVVFLEAMRSVFDPGFTAIKDHLPMLGTIRRASFQYCQYSSRYDKFKAGIVENAFDPSLSNGSLMDIGVYCVHPLVALFGMPERIHGEALLLENGIDGSGTILASYPGMQAELVYSKISDSLVPSQIQGEEGTMTIREIADPREITIRLRNGKTEQISVEKESGNIIYEIREWARLIENGLSAEPYNRFTRMELMVMDEARRQMGIVFPADREEPEKENPV